MSEKIDIKIIQELLEHLTSASFTLTDETVLIDYNFSLSFWLYLDADSNNSNADIEILNFNNHPKIKYNGSSNVMIFNMGGDENITYPNVELQKYNNWVLNYSSGNLDIFLNSILVRSKSLNDFTIPKQNSEMITLGNLDSANLSGKICNLLFFKHPMSLFQLKLQYYANKMMKY